MAYTKEHFENVLRKKWVRLVRLVSADQCQQVARQFLGSPKATLLDFEKLTGVNLANQLGVYIEYCGDEAPVAPLNPGIIKPILVFKQQEDGSIKALRWEIEGLYHSSKALAWILAETWEKLLGDENYLEENLELIVQGLENANRLKAEEDSTRNAEEEEEGPRAEAKKEDGR